MGLLPIDAFHHQLVLKIGVVFAFAGRAILFVGAVVCLVRVDNPAPETDENVPVLGVILHAIWSTNRVRARGWSRVGDSVYKAVHLGDLLMLAGLLPGEGISALRLLLLRHLLPLAVVLPLEILAAELLLLQRLLLRLLRLTKSPLLLAEGLSVPLVGDSGVGVGGGGCLGDVQFFHLLHGDKDDVIKRLTMTQTFLDRRRKLSAMAELINDSP